MANELGWAVLKGAAGAAGGIAMRETYPRIKPTIVETAKKVDEVVSSYETTPEERGRTGAFGEENLTFNRLSGPVVWGGLAAGVALGAPAVTFGAGVVAAAIEARSACHQQ